VPLRAPSPGVADGWDSDLEWVCSWSATDRDHTSASKCGDDSDAAAPIGPAGRAGSARYSRCAEGDIQKLRASLATFEALGYATERKGLQPSLRFILRRGRVRQASR
jgi:hypothetical protein